jgi:hypothetical protein
MIDIETERIIPCRQVPRYVPSRRPGKRVSPATIWRWLTRKDNPLESILIGGGRFTSVEAINRFIDRSRETPNIAPEASSPRAQLAGEELSRLIGSGKSGKQRGDQPTSEDTAIATSIRRKVHSSNNSPK